MSFCIFNQLRHRADGTEYRHIANASTLADILVQRSTIYDETFHNFIFVNSFLHGKWTDTN